MLDQKHWSATDAGIRVAASSRLPAREAVVELKTRLADDDYSLILIFFSSVFNSDCLIEELAQAFQGSTVCGCSTAGEITPLGLADDSVLAIAFPKASFRVSLVTLERIREISITDVFQACRDVRSRFLGSRDLACLHRAFAIMLVDGLSKCEEKIVAAVRSAIAEIPLAGGSAGDGLRFDRTILFCNGRIFDDGAIVILVEAEMEFRLFATHNFEPTPARFVVTAADTEKRIIYELDAEPASTVYAAAVGMLPEELTALTFASHPMAVKIGRQYYCRSIQCAHADGSLLLSCAIDEGLVLTLVRPTDIITSTRNALAEVERQLGSLHSVIGFDCIHRKLNVESRQSLHLLGKLYRDFHVSGFHTYGEQYNSMHLNSTLTGIAFGGRRAVS